MPLLQYIASMLCITAMLVIFIIFYLNNKIEKLRSNSIINTIMIILVITYCVITFTSYSDSINLFSPIKILSYSYVIISILYYLITIPYSLITVIYFKYGINYKEDYENKTIDNKPYLDIID